MGMAADRDKSATRGDCRCALHHERYLLFERGAERLHVGRQLALFSDGHFELLTQSSNFLQLRPQLLFQKLVFKLSSGQRLLGMLRATCSRELRRPRCVQLLQMVGPGAERQGGICRCFRAF